MLSCPGLDPETAFVASESRLRIQLDLLDRFGAGHKFELSHDRHKSHLGLEESEPHGQASPRSLAETQKGVPGKKARGQCYKTFLKVTYGR